MTIKSALRELNNAVLDLQSADYNTFERPLQRLSLVLNSPDLAEIVGQLKAGADFEAFVEKASQGGSMMGSARLNWPSSRQEELGLVIHLIERAAENPHWFLNFAHTYYYSGRKIVEDIRKITSAVIIPFNRDFSSFVEELAPESLNPSGSNFVTNDEDKDELLNVLYKMGNETGKRPSVQDARIKYLPDWSMDRLTGATEALLSEGAILNPTGAMLYVDLSSTARKRMESNMGSSTGVTYNIGAMHNSPLQHVSPGGVGTQAVTYSSDDLRAIVSLYKQHVDDLGLDQASRRRADAQIATIEAQLIDEPDPMIIQSAGKSLKTIVEGALGGAAGTAIAAAPIWAPLISMFGG